MEGQTETTQHGRVANNCPLNMYTDPSHQDYPLLSCASPQILSHGGDISPAPHGAPGVQGGVRCRPAENMSEGTLAFRGLAFPA